MEEVAKWGPLAQLGACGVLAFIVWRQQRDQTAALNAILKQQAIDSVAAANAYLFLPKVHDVMTQVQITMAGLLEHERFRLARKMAREHPAAWDEETQPFTIPPTQPKRTTDPMGVPVGRYSEHKPRGGG